MGVWFWPGAFGFFVGALPRKLSWIVFLIGLVIYFAVFENMGGTPGEGFGWGLFLGLFMLLPFFVGWFLGFIFGQMVRSYG